MYFIIFLGKNGQWYWNLNAANNRIIATGGEGYHNREDAIHAINLVRQSANSAGIYDKTIERWL